MLKNRTVFILGAGTSSELGLPLGSELSKIIASKMGLRFDSAGFAESSRGDTDLFYAFADGLPERRIACRRAVESLHRGLLLTNSIDDFLNMHDMDEDIKAIGKATICKSIVEAEAKTSLFTHYGLPHNINLSLLSNTWYIKFFRHLCGGLKKSDADMLLENVAFINFNYDRCVEQFLRIAIENVFLLTPPEAKQIADKANIYHPYGYIGPLDASLDISPSLYFGYAGTDSHYISVYKNIRTYSEQVDTNSRLTGVFDALDNAAKIIFLGFSFHPQNMKLLGQRGIKEAKKVFATAFNMSDPSRDAIKKQILSCFDPDTKMNSSNIEVRNDLSASAFIDEYYKVIFK